MRVLSARFAPAAATVTGPISVRINSQVFHVRISGDPELELAVKSCLMPSTTLPDARESKLQYEALTRLSRVSEGGQVVCVPEPVLLDEGAGIVAMSWVQGDSLTQLMRRPAVFRGGARAFEAVGAWLGEFHSLGPLRQGRYVFTERMAAIDELGRAGIVDANFGATLQLLSRVAHELTDSLLWISWLHGDCKTDNFLLHDRSVFGIDISLRYENAVEHDLAQFVNNLELMFADPRWMHLIALRSTLKSAFWRGYQRTGPRVSESFLCWYRLYCALSLWHSSLITGDRQSLSSWVMKMSLSRLVKELTRTLMRMTSKG